MPTPALLRSRIYRVACACSLALPTYVVARAPLWNSVMAGARVQLDSGQVALAPPAWECTDRPHTCATTLGGAPLVAKVERFDRPITCSVTFKGEPVACTTRLLYAPRLKPFLEIGNLPNVTFQRAIRERPWRLLDAGLRGEGEPGQMYLWAGVGPAFFLALGACSWFRRTGLWRIAQVAIAASTFALLSAVWLLQCVLLGYID